MRILALVALGTLCVGSSETWGGEAPSRFSMEAFPNLAARNLFDPDRSRLPQAPAERREERREQEPRPEFITLTGTMIHGPSAYAFFSGSQPEYRQILKPQEQIARFTVAQITTTHVLLQNDTNQLVLPVGRQLRQEDGGTWGIGNPGAIESVTSSSSSNSEAPPTALPGSPAPPSEEMNDLLKRMMERREKEISP